jgi:ubiquinone/menaquinone biosynthesis C-methylase UbiE
MANESAAMPDPKERFSSRVEAYVRNRPSYPIEAIRWLESNGYCAPGAAVADVGSGTGISTALFLKNGYSVAGVEPNAAMRQAAERWLTETLNPADLRRFRSVDGAAEATTLPDHSVELVIAAQAFHWFDRPAAKREFFRILKPAGAVALIWNSRELAGTSFAEGYEALLNEFCLDYNVVRHDQIMAQEIHDFFAPAPTQSATFPSHQQFDYAGLEGRLLSSSYAPPAEHLRHSPMLASLRSLFDRCQRDGTVVTNYRTEVHAGRLALV